MKAAALLLLLLSMGTAQPAAAPQGAVFVGEPLAPPEFAAPRASAPAPLPPWLDRAFELLYCEGLRGEALERCLDWGDPSPSQEPLYGVPFAATE